MNQSNKIDDDEGEVVPITEKDIELFEEEDEDYSDGDEDLFDEEKEIKEEIDLKQYEQDWEKIHFMKVDAFIRSLSEIDSETDPDPIGDLNADAQ